MQITFTAEQLSWIRTTISIVSTICTLGTMLYKGYHWVVDQLHKIITDNINRAIKENKDYANTKFEEHENSAFKRLDNQDVIINNLVLEVKKINEKLKNAN